MKAQFINNFLFYAILEIVLLNVFCLKNNINNIINEKVNIRNTDDLKNIFEIQPLIANQTYDKIEKTLKEQNNLKNKNLLGDRKDSKIFNISSIFSNIISNDISNITKRFSCFYFNEEDFSVYDMSQLDKEEPSDITLQRDASIKFKICQPANLNNLCDNVNKSYIVYKSTNSRECKVIAGDNQTQKSSEFFEDTATNTTGIVVNFPSGDECNPVTKERYQTSMRFICDSYLPLGTFSPIPSIFNLKKCQNTFEIRTANACSLTNHFPLLKFLQKYKMFVGAVMIVIGLFMMMWGTKFIEITFAGIIGLIAMQFGLKVYDNIHIENSNPDYIWIVLVISFLIGIGIAYFAMNMITFAKICMGGYLGYTFSLIVYQFILRYIHSSQPELIFWITTITCVILGAFLMNYLVKQVMIIATSLIGSYAVIKGISLYAGRFPNEQVIFELLKNKEFDQLAEVFSGIVVLYLVGWAILFLGGVFFQCKFFPEDNDNHKYYAK